MRIWKSTRSQLLEQIYRSPVQHGRYGPHQEIIDEVDAYLSCTHGNFRTEQSVGIYGSGRHTNESTLY